MEIFIHWILPGLQIFKKLIVDLIQLYEQFFQLILIKLLLNVGIEL